MTDTAGSTGQDRVTDTAAPHWHSLAIWAGGFVAGFITCGAIFLGWQ